MRYFWVAIFCGMLSSSSYAGLMLTDVAVSHKTPDCLEVRPGGVTGPGTGVTLANRCSFAVSITSVRGDEWPWEQRGPYPVYLSNDSWQQKKADAHDFSTNSSLGFAVAFVFADDGKVCDHATASTNGPDDTLTRCSSVSVAPAEAILIFSGTGTFKYEGQPGLLVKGESKPLITEAPNSTLKFGSSAL